MRPCPSCRHQADDCSYPGEGKNGCLRDKRMRAEMDQRLKGVTAKELRERIRQRAEEVKR